MQVPVFDLTRQNELLLEAYDKAFRTVIAHSKFILGDDVTAFEEKIAQYLGVEFAISVGNGSDALTLALIALDIGPGDEVIVPAFTFYATAGAVLRAGATPVFVDVKSNYNIDIEQIKERITENTKAVIPVHLFGLPVAMAELMSLAKEYGLVIIEDAAQAIGSTYDMEPVGTIGEIGCFSFFPTKNLGCLGDGGMVVTNQADLAERLSMLRVHGAKQKYHHELFGFNSRLDTLQAAFLNVKMPYLNGWIAARRKIAKRYREAFADIEEIDLPEDVEGHTYNQFTVIVSKRDSLRTFLTKNGVNTSIYYPVPLHLQTVFAWLGYQPCDLPVSENLSKTVLSLPIYPELSEAEQNYVIGKIQEFFSKKGRR